MEKFYFILIMLLCSVSVFSQTIQNSDSDMVFLDGKPDKKKSNEYVINPKYVIIGNGNNGKTELLRIFLIVGPQILAGILKKMG